MRALVALAAGDAREARPFFVFFAVLACAGVGVALLYRGPEHQAVAYLMLLVAGWVGAVLGGVSLPSRPRTGAGPWLDAAPLGRGGLWAVRCLRALLLFALCWAVPSVVAAILVGPTDEWSPDAALLLSWLMGGALSCVAALLFSQVSGIQGLGIVAGAYTSSLAQAGVAVFGGAAAGRGLSGYAAALYRQGMDPGMHYAGTYNHALLAVAVTLGGAAVFAATPPRERRLRGTRVLGYFALCGVAALPLALGLGELHAGLSRPVPRDAVGGIVVDPGGTHLTFCITGKGSRAGTVSWWAIELPDGEPHLLAHDAAVVRWQPEVDAFAGAQRGGEIRDPDRAFVLGPNNEKRVLGEFGGSQSASDLPRSAAGPGVQGLAGRQGPGAAGRAPTDGPGFPTRLGVQTQLWVAPNGEAVAARCGDESAYAWAYAAPSGPNIPTDLAFWSRFVAWSADGRAVYLEPGILSKGRAQVVRVGPGGRQETIIDLEGEFETVVHRDKRLVALSTGRLFGLGRAGGTPWAENIETRSPYDLATGWIVDLEAGRKTPVTDLGEVVGMAFSPDGKLLAGVAEAAGEKQICIRLYDVATGALTRTLTAPWRRLPVSPESCRKSLPGMDFGSPLPAATLRVIHPWLPNVSRAEEVPVDFSSVQWSPDGRYLLLCRGIGQADPSLLIWSKADGSTPATMDGWRDKPWRLVGWSADSRLVLALPSARAPAGVSPSLRTPPDLADEIGLFDPATGSLQTVLRTTERERRAEI